MEPVLVGVGRSAGAVDEMTLEETADCFELARDAALNAQGRHR